MVGMLAAAGALDQIGRAYGRAWGDVGDPAVGRGLDAHDARRRRRATGCAARRSGGSAGARWGCTRPSPTRTSGCAQFGVDVEEIDQWELVRRCRDVDGRAVDARRASGSSDTRRASTTTASGSPPSCSSARSAPTTSCAQLIDERNLDFSGIKAQPELTDNFATMDVTEAFLNDPYDWDGPKEPHVCATEADMDGR